jgi:23S rRNA (cytosine1962-C5)-methyltransferase
MTLDLATLRLTERASKLARKGHPWFFADDVEAGSAEPATLVRVETHDRRELGLAFHVPSSRLVLRMAGPRHAESHEGFFAQALETSLSRRRPGAGPRGAERLVHGDADGIPGLVVDRYADVLVVQVTSALVERYLGCVVPWLAERLSPRMVLARNDVAARRFEGLEEEVRMLHGDRVDEVEIEEEGIVHAVRPWTGHKTGFYLDQRPARARVRALAAGKRVLDAFAYQGGFALAALAGGATEAFAVDQSELALELAQRAAARNGLHGLTTERANAFDKLRELRRAGASYDLVVVDPPAFAKSKKELAGGARGYRDLNHLALRLLAEGGVLITCSCSHHVSLEHFETLLRQAAAELPFRVALRERISAGPDHPAWIALPESEYLKVLYLQRI